MCDPRPSDTVNAQIVDVNERGFDHKYGGNHCYEQEKNRNAERPNYNSQTNFEPEWQGHCCKMTMGLMV